MDKVYIGELIREERARQKISQEELCDRICSQVTLSRLENGTQAPSYSKVKALLEKLGLSDELYKVVNNADELRARDLGMEIRARVIAFEKAAAPEKETLRAEAWEATRQLEALAGEDPPTMQRIVQDRCVLGTAQGPYTPAEQRELLLEALHLTAPRFDPEHLDRSRYTQVEISLINQIAVTYAREKKSDQAIGLYRQLLAYIQAHNRQLSKYAGQLTMVAFNYSRELDAVEQYQEAVHVAELGRQACVLYDEHQFHPQILHVMAECLHYLGEDVRSRELYTQAHYCYLAFESKVQDEILKKDAQEQVGLTF